MRSNLGLFGRAIAFILAVLLFIIFALILKSRWAIISAVPLFAAISGFCPCKRIAAHYKIRNNN